jgi:hypothetical protein
MDCKFLKKVYRRGQTNRINYTTSLPLAQGIKFDLKINNYPFSVRNAEGVIFFKQVSFYKLKEAPRFKVN